MPFVNAYLDEIMVPHATEIGSRLQGFYEDIGWFARIGAEDDRGVLVRPDMTVQSFAMYWQTDTPSKIPDFTQIDSDEPSHYSRGLGLPQRDERSDRIFIMPTDEQVHRLYDLGGALLHAHAHVEPRNHAGSEEFRFVDALGISFRVTSPVAGWEWKTFGRNNEYAIEKVTSRDQYITQEHVLAYHATYVEGVSIEVARRAFGALVNPSQSFGATVADRKWLNPQEIGLKVVPRETVGIEPPKREMKQTAAIKVDSFLEFVKYTMDHTSLYGISTNTSRFLRGLAWQLNQQIESAKAND